MPPSDDQPVVCRVNPDGDIVCDPAVSTDDLTIAPDLQQRAEKALTGLFPKGSWGPNKVRLALAVLDALDKSELPDDRIPRRSGEIVESTRMLLAKEPPSILLYNYSSQPADIIGAYYLNRAQLVQMQRLYDRFKDPVKP